jgi:hypothetical protein
MNADENGLPRMTQINADIWSKLSDKLSEMANSQDCISSFIRVISVIREKEPEAIKHSEQRERERGFDANQHLRGDRTHRSPVS